MEIKIVRKSHVAAIIFAVVLLIFGLLMFITFAYGAFMFFNAPISNVVVTTTNVNPPALVINGSQFAPNASRQVWIDPQFSPENSNFFNPNTGYLIGTVRTDKSGGISTTLNLSTTLLQQIRDDGQSVHQVWIIGQSQTGGNAPYTESITADSQTNISATTRIGGIALFASLYVFELPLNVNLGQVFLAFWTIYVILFAMVLNGPVRNAFSAFKETAKRGVKALFENPFFTILVLFPVALWGSDLLLSFQQAVGVPTGALPPTDPLLEFASITVAPLREELGFRVIPIGVVALVILFARGRIRDGIVALWHPSKYLKKSDTPAQYRSHLHLMYVIVALSAFLFGLAHYLGGGWDVGKITQAGAVGIALAVLYYQYGFPSAVMFHWAFDYLTIVEANSSLVSQLFYVYLSIAIAIPSTILLIALAVKKYRNRTALGGYPLVH